MSYVKKKTSGNEIYVGLNLKGLFLLDLSKMFFLSFHTEILVFVYLIIEESRPHVKLSQEIKTPDFPYQFS